MTLAQRRNRLTTHFLERIPVIQRRINAQSSFGVEKLNACQGGTIAALGPVILLKSIDTSLE